MSGLELDAVKQILQRSYPAVAHTTIRQRTLENDGTCYDFMQAYLREELEVYL